MQLAGDSLRLLLFGAYHLYCQRAELVAVDQETLGLFPDLLVELRIMDRNSCLVRKGRKKFNLITGELVLGFRIEADESQSRIMGDER